MTSHRQESRSPDSPSTLVGWLATVAAYSHAPQAVEHYETHISHVFLAGEHVYKLKKPLRFDFLDFSTLAAREHACRQEVRLNRRLAPHAYLGVVPVSSPAEGVWELDGKGPIVEWLVHMRRLPTEQTLDELHRRGQLTAEAIDRLGGLLTDFYCAQPALPFTTDEYCGRLAAHILGNRRELTIAAHNCPRAVVSRVHAFQLQLLALAPELFANRSEQGRIVDGHGDLRPEHICLTNPPVIFDCIEFRDEFRENDIADELAFLAAECDLLGADWAGPRLLEFYEKRSGDVVPPVLWAFYKCYRACVRAKVAVLRADQEQPEQHAAALAEARQRLALADRYAMPWLKPLVIAVGGAAGTGKSTLAKSLAETLGAEVLRTDVLRQELFDENARAEPDGPHKYAEASRRLVYSRLFERAEALRKESVSVVLDGTFSTAGMIEQAHSVAQGAGFLAVECVCRPEIARARIAQRLATGEDASEAQPETHDQQRQTWTPWPSSLPQVRVDTELPLMEQVAHVLKAMRRQ